MKFVWHGPRVKAEARRGAARGLRQAAEFALAKSREVVPVEEGTLSRSGASAVDEGALVAAVSYNTPYAVRQHEELGYRHAPGRTAKYLERPMIENSKTFGVIIADAIRRDLGS